MEQDRISYHDSVFKAYERIKQDCRQVTGGLLNVETDTLKAADSILNHIEDNRSKLGI